MLIPPKKEPTLIDLSIEDFRIDLSREDITQQIVVTIQGQTILTLGSLAILTGKPKARKTSFLHAFLASGLMDDSLWGIRTKLPHEKNGICLIDTEQSLFDLYQSMARLSSMIGRKLTELNNFSVYSTRAGDVDKTMMVIETICKKNPNIGLMAIDGLIDLVNDINDVREAKAAINFLKKCCDTYNVAIIGIIHQNKSTNFSLGHLGSFASRFAQSELSIDKNDDTSTMAATFLRSAKDFNPINITYDETNGRYDLTENVGKNINPNDLQLIQNIFGGTIALTYKDLVSRAKMITNCNNYQVEKKFIPVWYANRLIEKRGNLIQICPVL
jgi:hypothetical protein